MNPFKRFFQEDIPATFSAGKWRIDLLQLKSRLTQLERQKNALLGELGTKAWGKKVKNESYSTVYGKLEELDGLAGQTQQELDVVQNKINLETTHLNTINTEFITRLKGTQSQRQVALQKLAQLQTVQKEIDQRILQFQATINQGAANLQNLKAQAGQIQASDQMDKEEKIASIQNTEAAVKTKINIAELQISTAKAELANHQVEQMPIKSEIDGYNQQIITMQDQNKLTQTPIQEQLKLLHQDLLKINEKKTRLLNQITALMPEFGGQVYKYRPLNDALTAEYAKNDVLQNEIKTIADQINLTQARLSSINSGSIQKVALAGGGLVFLVFAIVVLTVWVVPTAIKLLTPDPKSSIKLVESWQLDDCEAIGSSTGVYYDISLWENRRGDAVATAETEANLLGANDIVLDSGTNEIEIAPGGMAVSMISLDARGSRVQKIERSVNSAYFVDTSINLRNLYDAKTYFEKAKNSNNITLGLEISNKSDFGLTESQPGIALVINKQNKVIDVLMGYIEGGTIDIDSISKVIFESGSYYDTSSCFQDDYTQEEVSFWYFIPLQISTNTQNQFSVSGKAVYTP